MDLFRLMMNSFGGGLVQVSVSELKENIGKYISLASGQDVYITKNGKRVARITSVKKDKMAVAQALFGILPGDVNLDITRTERIERKTANFYSCKVRQ